MEAETDLKNKKLKDLSGVFLVGRIEGVDFVVAGEIEGNKYGSSIKLKFARAEKITKKVNGNNIVTTRLTTNVIKIAVEDSQLIQKIEEFNSKLGKDVCIDLILADNQSFNVNTIEVL